MIITIINGPNLNLLGKRESSIYGEETFDSFLQNLKEKFHDIEFNYYQSNIEGEIVGQIQSGSLECDGIILNAGGYTHTSVAIRDAVSAIKAPVVEVHISNVMDREGFRHISLISSACAGIISGFGIRGYELAVEAFVKKIL